MKVSLMDALKLWWHGRSTLQNPSEWLRAAFGARKALSGVPVTDKTALESTANHCAVSFKSDLMSMIPIHVIQKDPKTGRKQRLEGHPLEFVLNVKANPDMSAFTYRETTELHISSKGRAFSQIVRLGNEVIELWPLDPNETKPEYKVKPGTDLESLWYVNQAKSGRKLELLSRDVCHFRVMAWNGIETRDKNDTFREALGLALAMERWAAAYFGNGARPDGVIEVEEELGPELVKLMAQQWTENYSGVENAKKTAILDNGAKYKPIQANPEEAQAIEGRKFQIDEISRMHRIPPHFLGNMDRATFSNIEEQGINLVRYTMLPAARRNCAEMDVKLLTDRELRQGIRLRYALEALEAGEVLKRYQAYAIGINWGILSPNEARRKEDMNDREDGDIYLQPTNMAPSGTNPLDLGDGKKKEEVGSRDAESVHRLHRAA